ncbi:hypothetical protein EBZ80_16145 [bacterium]|nr:hypothetical protein [bacterium]
MGPSLFRNVKKFVAAAGLALAAHQIMLVPHALCRSMESNTGDPVEFATDNEAHECHQDNGIAVADHGHHHNHCDHELPDSSQSNSDIQQAVIVGHITFDCGATPVPSANLILTSRDTTSATSTSHFVQHVRILS